MSIMSSSMSFIIVNIFDYYSIDGLSAQLWTEKMKENNKIYICVIFRFTEMGTKMKPSSGP